MLTERLGILLVAPKAIDKQPATLRAALRLLSCVRVRRVANHATFTVALCGYDMGPSVIHELHSLHSYNTPVILKFQDCTWHTRHVDSYRALLAHVPPCYSNVVIGHTASTVMATGFAQLLTALCQGAVGRGEECGRLRLSVRCWPAAGSEALMSDEERSAVESAIEEQGLGRAVDLQWF